MTTPNVWGQATDRVLQVLRSHGEMTTLEITKRTGIPGDVVRRICGRLAEPSPRHEKRIYICAWGYEMLGKRNYPRPIYDVGDQPNVPKPKIKNARVVHSRAYRARRTHVQWGRVASVFHIGDCRI